MNMLSFEASLCGRFAVPSSPTSVSSTASAVMRSTFAFVIHLTSRSRSIDFENALGIANAAEPEMADIGFGGDKGDRHPIANLAPAQIGIDLKRELIGRAKT